MLSEAAYSDLSGIPHHILGSVVSKPFAFTHNENREPALNLLT